MSDIHKICGFCDLLAGLLRRVMCVGNRPGSSDTHYRELGDQDTMRFDERLRLSSESLPSEELRQTFQNEIEQLFRELSHDMKGLNKKKPIRQFHSFKKHRWNRFSTVAKDEKITLDDCYPKQVELLLSKSTTWEFDTHDLDRATGGRCLPVLCMHLFHVYGLIDFFKLLPEKCWKLFHSIEESYHANNPYHNSVHAADVTQAIHCFLQQPPLLESVNKMEILAVLLAAITHDIDHPGVNDSYLVATKHPLAVIYKERAHGILDRTPPLPRRRKRGKCDSILEHHHWRAAYSCILQSGIFEHMSGQMPVIRQMLKSLILATDITRQNDYLNIFKEHLEYNTLDMKRFDHRLMVLQMALKTADISNPGRPWSISKKWSYKVCDEFFDQGDEERKRNINVSYLCDREKDTIPRIQTGFFRYIVTPLFTEWHHYLNSDLSRTMLKNLIHNEAEWTREDQRSAQNSNTLTDLPTSSGAPFINDGHLVENSLATSLSISGSSEMLIPFMGGSEEVRAPCRNSCSPVKQTSIRDAIRYSVPLHIFIEPRSRAQKNSISECSLREEVQEVVNTITHEVQETEVENVAVVEDRPRCNFKQMSMLDNTLLFTADKNRKQEILTARKRGTARLAFAPESGSIAQSREPGVTKNASFDTDSNKLIDFNFPRRLDAVDSDTESSYVAKASKGACSSELLTLTPPGVADEVKDVLFPQLSITELYLRRRGSAPAPLAVCELQRLASNVSLQLGGRTCKQWIAAEESPATARRGSLPVEMMIGA